MSDTGKEEAVASPEPTLTKQQLEQIVGYLKKSGEYVVMTKEEFNSFSLPVGSSTPAPTVKQAAKPKVHDSNINPLSQSLQMPKYDIPKLPYFSGDQPPMKGEESYSVWRFETRCMISENLPEHVSLQVVRKSLRGTARWALISLGEAANLEEVLDKLDMLFGNVATNESVMQSFYNENQKPTENVTTYGCRIESLLQVAVENGHVNQIDRNDMLRSKFWNGLRDEKLKILTRNKYDTILDFNRLLREVRSVELELTASNHISTPAKVSQQQCPKKEKDTNEDLCNKMDALMSRLSSLEKQMSEQKAQSSSHHQFNHYPSEEHRYDHRNNTNNFNDNRFRQDNQRSRGRGGNRPWQDRRGRRGNYYNNDNSSNFFNRGQPKDQTP